MSITSVISRFSVQDAIYWGNPTPDGYGGYNYDDPIAIKCRWDDSSKVISNKKGEELISNAQILTNEELSVGGLLMLGTLEDLTELAEDSSVALDSDQFYLYPKQIDSGIFRIETKDKQYMPRSTTQCVRIYYLKPNWETKL